MIRKLQRKFVFAAMLSLLVVLTAIIGAAGFTNYKHIQEEADQKLQMLVANNGQFPERPEKGGQRFSAEMPFETRYFSVTIDASGEITACDTGSIASVDGEQAADYAEEVLKKEKSSGFIDTYRFFSKSNDSDSTTIYFLSCERELQSFHGFLRNILAMAAIGFAAVFILLLLTSQRIVKPVSDAYEKQKGFITDAGHELKTPLTIISADTEVLEMDYGKNEWIEDIRTQTTRLASLTNDLVFLARMEEEPKLLHEVFSLSEAAEDAAADFLAVAKVKGATIETSIAPSLSMNGDEKMMRRLLSILLDNAVKYTDENGLIRISLEQSRGQIRLSVYNTTQSIKRDNLPHLFDRFYRTDQSRNSATGGHGLGLSIAAAIVRSHNGKITATTDDEKSLCITAAFRINTSE